MTGFARSTLFAITLAALTLSPAHAADADMAARSAKARIIVEQTMPAGQRDAMFAQMMDGMMANILAGMLQGNAKFRGLVQENKKIADVFAAFVTRQKKLALDDLRDTTPEMIEAIAGAYAKRFTLAELVEIEAFVLTATGARFLQTGPALFSDPGVAAWQRNITEKSQARLRAEVTRFLEELKPIVDEADATPSKS